MTPAGPRGWQVPVLAGLLLACLVLGSVTWRLEHLRAAEWRANVRTGQPALASWGWRGGIPYLRRVVFVDDVSAAVPRLGRKDGSQVYGAYAPSTGLIYLRTPALGLPGSWSGEQVPGQHASPFDTEAPTYVHEYGHALVADWCRSRYGAVAGAEAEALVSSTRATGRSWQRYLVPAELRGPMAEWLAGEDPEAFYGDTMTGDLGEYLADSFSHYVRGGRVPPETRVLFESWGGSDRAAPDYAVPGHARLRTAP